MPAGPRVVTILGYGRSGATVLDVVLGNHPRATSVGELSQLPRVLAAEEEEYCACGTTARACPFWADVLARWRAGGADLERYGRLSARVERPAALVRALALPAASSAARDEWAALTRSLFQAIAAASGAEVVVDSSKLPARAWALARVPSLDVFVVHLVRDGRGVAWSLRRAYERDVANGVQRAFAPVPVTRTALSWTVVNALARRVYAQAPPERRALLRYEDWVGDLATALAPLQGFLGGGLEELAAAARGNRTFAGGHAIAGNRVRMRGRLELRLDSSWREGMPPRERRRFWRIAAPLMKSFGYAE
jgi:hypothetical protein